MALAACTEGSWQPHREALCHDTRLMGQLAKLTAACHAALPAWVDRDSAGHAAFSHLVTWAGRWGHLPWQLPMEGGEHALLPLLVAASSILQRAAESVPRLALPEATQHHDDGDPPVHGGLLDWWITTVTGIGRMSLLLLRPPAGAAPAAGRRALRVFLAVTGTGPAVARFFATAGAAPASDGPPQEQSLADPNPALALDLAAVWLDWLKACHAVFTVLPVFAAGLTTEQQEEAAAAGIGLARTLVWLAPQQPQLEHAVSVSPACTQPEQREGGQPTFDVQLLLQVLKAALDG
jgi:hypothetical protein